MGRPGVAAQLFDGLSRVGISLRMIATSEVKVSCLIQGEQAAKALRTAAQVFELDDHQLQHNPVPGGEGEPDVRGVALDRDQAQLTVTATGSTRISGGPLPGLGRWWHQPRHHRAIGASTVKRSGTVP